MVEREGEQHPMSVLLLDLANDEALWQAIRLRTAGKARLFMAAGVKASVVAKVLGVSERTLYRRVAEEAAGRRDEADETAAVVAEQAARDQEAAEAWDGGAR